MKRQKVFAAVLVLTALVILSASFALASPAPVAAGPLYTLNLTIDYKNWTYSSILVTQGKQLEGSTVIFATALALAKKETIVVHTPTMGLPLFVRVATLYGWRNFEFTPYDGAEKKTVTVTVK